MAKPGYASMTIHNDIYDLWNEAWEKQKDFCIQKGITTLTGYVNAVMFGVLMSPELQIQSIKIAHEKEMEQFVKKK